MPSNRKPPPRLTSPPPQQMTRKPSLHTGHDEQGRPVAWGASRAQSRMSGLGPIHQGVGQDEESDQAGEEAVGLLQPTPRREGEGEALSNFEAAVQALRSTGVAGASSSGSSEVSSSTAPSRRSFQSQLYSGNQTGIQTGHYVKRNHHHPLPTPQAQAAPVDLNYPSSIQFHKSAGYISVPSVKPVVRTNGYQALDVNGNASGGSTPTVGIGAGLPDLPVYRPGGGLPMPVSMQGNKNQTGLGIGLHPVRAEEDEGPASTARNGNGRNVSGPLRRRGRRSRSPTPFPDDEDEDAVGGTARAEDKENTVGLGGGRPDPFGSIEMDLARRKKEQEKAELTAIYDTAVRRQALKKGYAMYVDVEADGHGDGTGDMGEVEMMETVPRYPYNREDEEKRRSVDLVSYHTKDPRSSVYAPFDHADEKDGLDIGDYKHTDGPNDLRYQDETDDDDDDEIDEKSKFPPSSTAHFGPAPQGRVMRRHLQKKAKKVVELTEGNLVIDLKIPTKLEGFLPAATRGRMGEDGDEVLYTRYSAVTSTPDDFVAENFTLRQTQYGRETELMIVITMYNEDEILFLRTLHGVMRNIGHLEGRKNSGTWGPGSWKKVVVCIVADGRKNISPRVLDCLASLGVYQEGAMKNSVQDKPVQAHVFEYTCTMGLTPDMKFKFASTDKGMVPTQILFCLKEKNAKKINSHRWFFNAFCRSLEPKVCILLDVGTRPGPKSLYHLWKAFDQNSQVGGACGEIAVYKGRAWKSLLNPLVACQNFEYKISNVLDKTTESVFGYCAVLPGAFSAYRWLALQNDTTGKGPLASYFKGEVLHGRDADMFTANMYLAEDRILCWEIVAKPKHNYVLKYVSAAVGETDAPEAIPEFISQRRRWLNGSFFAAVYALTHVFDLFKTEHSFFRKMALLLQAFYNAIMLAFSWFSLANFYIFFIILTSALEDPAFGVPKISILNAVMQYVYLGTVIACFIFSMGNRPQGSVWKYTSAVVIFAVLTVYMIAAAIVCMVQAFKNIHDPIFAQMIVSVVSTYAVFVVASLLAADPFHLLTSAGQYILFQASSINILNVYGFANTNDVSWGTKGADTTQNDLGAVKGVGNEVEVELLADQHDVDAAYSEALDNLRVRKPMEAVKVKSASQEEQMQKDYYANVRTNVLLGYVLSNALLASVILGGSSKYSTFSESSSRTSVYMLCILIFVAGTNLFRLIGAILYLLMGLVTRLRGIF